MKVEIEIDMEDVFNNLTWKEQEEFIFEHLDILSIDTLREYIEDNNNQ